VVSLGNAKLALNDGVEKEVRLAFKKRDNLPTGFVSFDLQFAPTNDASAARVQSTEPAKESQQLTPAQQPSGTTRSQV